MLKNNLGYPRIGIRRELKKSCERFWSGQDTAETLLDTARVLRHTHWKTQADAGIDLIPCNDFSLYDQVLDTIVMTGAVPERYASLQNDADFGNDLTTYFAMARGYQHGEIDLHAMEMTKWFDTNYHYIVPEFTSKTTFRLNASKVLQEFAEAKRVMGEAAKVVLLGPVSFLLSGKEKEAGFHRLDLLDSLLSVYAELLVTLAQKGATWVQLDEPHLVTDLDHQAVTAYKRAYPVLKAAAGKSRLMLATYFGGIDENTELVTSLPVDAIHVDLVRGKSQLYRVLSAVRSDQVVSLGVVDGRNIWKDDYAVSGEIIRYATKILGDDRVMIAPSCSLLHCPVDLDAEQHLDSEIKNWMAFSRQKLTELDELVQIYHGEDHLYEKNHAAIQSRKTSTRIHLESVKNRILQVDSTYAQRASAFQNRQIVQKARFGLPEFPTTTIGSFPQTTEISRLRLQLKKGEITPDSYHEQLQAATEACITLQEDIGLDVLVHGEFERNDMVEYFGEKLDGFAFTDNGWVQSYGSRCVKPPVIYGDVRRPGDMTVEWARFAQQQTPKPMKGMLTGPVTILQWSFVRTDQPRSDTALQIALAIRDEVEALEKAGIGIIQIDEPAIREGLPLRKREHEAYLKWAVHAFRVASAVAGDATQIHTHMCYSEFNDIMLHIAAMDADVITIETSRSQMELLEAFAGFQYPNEIGPGVYDIHSPRVPDVDEMVRLLNKALEYIPRNNVWVNPDCGLKTRKWPETEAALRNMTAAAQLMRRSI